MNVTFTRSVDPYSFDYSVALNSADISAAFFEQIDPDEELFYTLYSPQFMELSASQQLLALSKAASLVEMASQAGTLNLAASPPEPKE